MREKISVIIPIYRTEQYLEGCIESVLEQKGVETEILLVDDGSPDRCPEICDDYASRYDNIVVLHKENGGIGAARTTGLEAACGDYVCFLDSDDLLDGERALDCLLQRARETGADITTGGFRRMNGETVSCVNSPRLREGAYTKTVDFRFRGFYRYGHLAYNWGKLYRRSFLSDHNLKCPSYPYTQDKAHNIRCCACEPVYAFIQESTYLYRDNESSVTYGYKKDFTQVWVRIAADFQEDLKTMGKEGEYGDLAAFHIFFGAFFLVKQELIHGGLRDAGKKLREYCATAPARKELSDLAKGRYLKEIDSPSWRLVIRLVSILLDLHLYGLITLGIYILRGLKVDRSITRRRYQGEAGPDCEKTAEKVTIK